MVEWLMLRRMLVLGLVLSFAGAGPSPLSACALLSSSLTECADPGAASLCDNMNMGESQARVAAAQDLSCCFVQAPLPTSQYQAPESSIVSIPAEVHGSAGSVQQELDFQVEVPIQDSSPPSLQSLLCTFLI